MLKVFHLIKKTSSVDGQKRDTSILKKMLFILSKGVAIKINVGNHFYILYISKVKFFINFKFKRN